MLKVNRVVLVFILFLAPLLLPAATSQSWISSVRVSPEFFNPSRGEDATISFRLNKPGTLSVVVVDRDGYALKTLISQIKTTAGPRSIRWDGKTLDGKIVPDEAYSLQISLASGNHRFEYFPANTAPKEVKVSIKYYDRNSGIIAYTLTKPARIHLQAGAAVTGPKGATNGPVFFTVVNREPRTRGTIVEHWNAYDESGTIRVDELSHFAMAIAASALPEHSLITTGNRSTTFIDAAVLRTGNTLFTWKAQRHEHHMGLSALDDVSPRMQLKPAAAAWNAKDRLWRLDPGKSLQISVKLTGPTAENFSRQPGFLIAFVNEQEASKSKAPVDAITVPQSLLHDGVNRIAVNWGSRYGGTSTDSFLLLAGAAQPQKKEVENGKK